MNQRRVMGSEFAWFVALGVLLAAVPAVGARADEAPAWTLDSALKQIDSTTGDFRTAVADVELTAVDDVAAEPRTESGKAYFSGDGSFRFDLSAPEEKTLLCDGQDLFVYKPALGIVERYQLDKHPERLEPYASLGFLLTGKALTREYVVGLLGEEMVDEQKTLLLELTPKSDELRAKVSRIQLWIEQGSWLPLQQKIFHTGAVQSVTARYLHTSRNVPVDKNLFKAKWPRDTQTIKK